jgi:hypothetical protein
MMDKGSETGDWTEFEKKLLETQEVMECRGKVSTYFGFSDIHCGW